MEIQNRIYTFEEVRDIYSKYITKPEDLAFIEKAYRFAEKKHEGQFRKSGDPYITHCIGVAEILSVMGTGPETICAGFLHDTIEDTGTTREEISSEFGEEVATLVEALTKVTRLSDYKNVEFTAENHRKIFVAMAKDVRVIVVKLADRLHNMRTMQFQPPEKQKRISNETLGVYAPIAHRLGLYKVETELEDLSLYYLYPETYEKIQKMVDDRVKNGNSDLLKLKNQIMSILSSTGIPFEITDRVKSIYSIYKKMENKDYSFDQIYDVLALRVITKTEQNCYEILGYIHANYKPVPGRFKDYIAMPKANLYQSLHTTVVTDTGEFFEVQIRTNDMDEVAENGIAAHWRYKEGTKYDSKKEQVEIENQLHWFKDFVKMTDDEKDTKDTETFVNSLSRDIFDANVFVFTPKGNVISLPSGSTPIDFAYRIHSAVGEHMTGAKVNGVLVPISQELKTGDIVDVLTSPKASPNSEWVNIAKTSFAKSKIRKYLIHANADYMREDQVKNGKAMLSDIVRDKKLSFSVDQILDAKTLSFFKMSSAEDLFLALSTKAVTVNDVLEASTCYKNYVERMTNAEAMTKNINSGSNVFKNTDDMIILPNGDSVLTSLASCCTPIPGDEIIGYVSNGQGVKVHRADCKNILKEDIKSRLIRVRWNPNAPSTKEYPVALAVECHDRDNLLVDILNSITLNNGKAIRVNAKYHSNNHTTTVALTIMVRNVETLNHFLTSIMAIKSVIGVSRIDH